MSGDSIQKTTRLGRYWSQKRLPLTISVPVIAVAVWEKDWGAVAAILLVAALAWIDTP